MIFATHGQRQSRRPVGGLSLSSTPQAHPLPHSRDVPQCLQSSFASQSLQTDAQADLAHSEIAYVRAPQNMPTPISRLPTEVFIAIMQYVCTPNPPPGKDSEYDEWKRITNHKEERAAMKATIRCSHVCQRWRETMLNTPLLWTRICVEDLPWPNELLSRSQDASLTIIRALPISEAIWPVLAASLSRVHTLIMSVQRGSEIPRFVDIFLQAFPRLVVLHFDTSRYGTIMSNQYAIPSDLFLQCPKLRRLKITGPMACGYLLSSPILRQLSHLEISRSISRINTHHSIGAVCHALALTNQLQSLILENVLHITAQDIQDGAAGSVATVHLPSLQQLKITDTFSVCTELASRLRVPHDAQVAYVLNEENPSSHHANAAVSRLLFPFSSSPMMPVTTVHFAASASSKVHLVQGWDGHLSSLTGDIGHSDVVPNSKSIFRIMSPFLYQAPNRHGSEPDSQLSLLEANEWTFLETVEDLVVYVMHQDDRFRKSAFDVWRVVLQRLQSVKRLVLGSSNSLLILALIAGYYSYGEVIPTWIPAPDTTPDTFLPNLSVI